MNWCSQEVFDKAVREEALSSKTVVVPKLMLCDKVECLRIKIVDKKERSTLCQWTHNMPTRFEKVKSRCGKVQFFFGYEPYNLEHDNSLGILVSYWAKDPKVTKLKLTYDFAVSCLGVFGLGYGSRGTVPSVGMNSYTKKTGRGTKRTTTSPFQAPEEIEQQQYYRVSHWNQLLQPAVRKKINQLSYDVFCFARHSNPYYMQLVDRICNRQILTTGISK